KPKTEVTATTISPQKIEYLSATASKDGNDDLTTVFDDSTVTNHVASKPKDEDNSARRDNSKNQYLDTTEETQNTTPSNTEEESTVTFATRAVSNPGTSKNLIGKKKTPRKNDSKSDSINSTTDFMPEGEFLVFSDHCKIPNIDPYHPSILKYVQESPPLVCKKVSFFNRTALLHTTATLFVSFWIQHSPQRWIGRGAVMAWPPRSPDLTLLDFYLWGYVKQHVYSERINDINHLKQRITDVIHSLTPDVLTRVWEELDYRLDMCRATNGAHIELR
ncbi:hypothetical protein AVEN_182483-1, partial [Araneus ventricosus]